MIRAIRRWLRDHRARRRAMRFLNVAVKAKVKALNREAARERQRRGAERA